MGNKLKTLSYFLLNGKQGEVYYSDKKDKDITAINNVYKAKIKTQNVLLIEDAKVKKITKITHF